MQYMSDEYHASMAQPIRNRSHIRAEIYRDGGDTISFSEDQIVNFSRHDFCSPISESLPTSDMTLVINNRDMTYDPDNENSPITLLQKGLRMMVQMGYEIDGDGTITWIPAFYGYLSDWDASDTEATFTAQDILFNLSMEYPLCYPYNVGVHEGMRELVDELAKFGGVTGQVSFYTHGGIVMNALPSVPVSEGFQVVANACGAILSISRDGKIVIGGVINTGVSTTGYNDTDYSNSDNLPEDARTSTESTIERIMYAVQSNGGAVVGKPFKFAPVSPADRRDGSGYTSELVANSSGAFATNPKIRIYVSGKRAVTEFGISFLGKPPVSLTASSYDSSDTLIESVSVSNLSSYQNISGDFGTPEYIDVEFTGAEAGAAVMVSVIYIDPISDFTITRSMMSRSPMAKRQDKIKSISVAETTWTTDSGDQTEVYRREIAMSAGETLTVVDSFGTPINHQTCSFDITGTGVTWTGRYSMYGFRAKIEAASDTTATIVCTANTMSDTVVNAKKTFGTNGIDVSWNNPMNDGTFTDAIEQLLEEHYLGTVDYEIPWRGDPCVDVNDKVWLELKDGSKVPIRIYDNTLNYNGVLSGTIRARRVVDF